MIYYYYKIYINKILFFILETITEYISMDNNNSI